jgi:hypothetical protein
MQNNEKFSQLGYMSQKMHALAESQDKIVWRNFTGGYISTHFYNIQWFHLLMSLPQWRRLDQTVHFKNSLAHLLAMDIQEHFSA